MAKKALETTERSRLQVLSENIRKLLFLNHFSQKEAARLAGLKLSTLNSWIQMVSYPREKNLQKLADLLHVDLLELTGDFESADERRRYLTIGASDMLASYSGDREFQRWCDLGLKIRRQKRLGSYIKILEELLENNDQESWEGSE